MSSKSAAGLTDSDLDLEHRTAYRFAILADGSMRCLAGMFAPKFGLTVAGWKIMAIIGHYEPVFPVDAARHATMDADKVTRAVDQLVVAGWVTRTVDSEDRRRLALNLTKKGRAIYEEIDHARRVIERQFLSVLNARELKLFYQVMDKLDAQGRKLFTGKNAWKAIADAEGLPAPTRTPRVSRATATKTTTTATPRKRKTGGD
jgi:DNA-binding MarR family transcriptional regulator